MTKTFGAPIKYKYIKYTTIYGFTHVCAVSESLAEQKAKQFTNVEYVSKQVLKKYMEEGQLKP